jgi:hypothetical protein
LAQFFAHVDQLSEWYLTLAAICLPFSALWASATPDQTQSSATRIPFFGSSKGSGGSTTLNSFHKKSLVSEKSDNHDPLNFDVASEIPPLSGTGTAKVREDDLEAGTADQNHLDGQSHDN